MYEKKIQLQSDCVDCEWKNCVYPLGDSKERYCCMMEGFQLNCSMYLLNCSMYLEQLPSDGRKPIIVTGEQENKKQGDKPITGGTTIHGVVLSVIDGVALLRVHGSGDIPCTTKKPELLKSIKNHSGEVIGASGIATWKGSDFDLVSFLIEEIIPYGDGSIVETMNKLREVAGPVYDKLDLDKYFKEMRGGD